MCLAAEASLPGSGSDTALGPLWAPGGPTASGQGGSFPGLQLVAELGGFFQISPASPASPMHGFPGTLSTRLGLDSPLKGLPQASEEQSPARVAPAGTGPGL